MLGISFEFADGKRERLTEVELDALCEVLWSCDEKGAVNLAGRISHERRRPPVLQASVRISESESRAFRTALDRTRESPNDAKNQEARPLAQRAGGRRSGRGKD